MADAFGGDRERAKIAMISAMYGQTSGDAAPLLQSMRSLYPRALGYVDAAAQAGEEGRLVRSWLGRTCPPPSQRWRTIMFGNAEEPLTGDEGGRMARSRGRFTRNFVIQATAAEWALVFMASVRRKLTALDVAHGVPQMVFFQHDELVLHVPRPISDSAVEMLREAGEETKSLMFGDTWVRFPLDIAVVTCYADA